LKIIITATIAIVILMIGAQAVYAEQFGHQYYWGWRDGYYMWAFSAQTHDNFSWPNDDEGHPPNYWKGADAGREYAKEHVMVKVINGHVLTQVNQTTRINDWFDGQSARIWGDAIPTGKSYPNSEFVAGYDTAYGTLPHEVDPNNLAKKLSGP
jgi:hypothetical protein